MADRWDVNRVLDDCERYWRETGVPRRVAPEMRLELEQHLTEAIADGRPIEAVLGTDVASFAEAWASEWRADQEGGKTWEEITSGRAARQRRDRLATWAYVAGGTALVAGVVVGAALGGSRGGDSMENEIWRWLWTGLAIVMGVGEIFTAGFFLLPFAVGATAAAILAWVGVHVLAQWLVFFAVSLLALVYLQRFIHKQDREQQPRVGANRWVNAEGLVLQDIDPVEATGMVRVEGEQWRATTDGDVIPTGTKVVVTEVRGARLVVTSRD